jgi:hypothetical protein
VGAGVDVDVDLLYITPPCTLIHAITPNSFDHHLVSYCIRRDGNYVINSLSQSIVFYGDQHSYSSITDQVSLLVEQLFGFYDNQEVFSRKSLLNYFAQGNATIFSSF